MASDATSSCSGEKHHLQQPNNHDHCNRQYARPTVGHPQVLLCAVGDILGVSLGFLRRLDIRIWLGYSSLLVLLWSTYAAIESQLHL